MDFVRESRATDELTHIRRSTHVQERGMYVCTYEHGDTHFMHAPAEVRVLLPQPDRLFKVSRHCIVLN